MLPEDDRMIETCRSVLSVLMKILDFLNYIYIIEETLARSNVCSLRIIV